MMEWGANVRIRYQFFVTIKVLSSQTVSVSWGVLESKAKKNVTAICWISIKSSFISLKNTPLPPSAQNPINHHLLVSLQQLNLNKYNDEWLEIVYKGFVRNLPVDTFYVLNRTVKYNCQQTAMTLQLQASCFHFSELHSNIIQCICENEIIKDSCPQQQSVSSSLLLETNIGWNQKCNIWSPVLITLHTFTIFL